MKLRVLIVTNNLSFSPDGAITRFSDWVKENVADVEIEYKEVNLPLKWKDFGVKIGDTSYWGLDGIKAQLRPLVSNHTYHVVCFMYEAPDSKKISEGIRVAPPPIANWTYPNPLNGAAFMEVINNGKWDNEDVADVMTHELMHCLHRRAHWKGYYTLDTMDVDNDRQANMARIRPYLDKILAPTIWTQLESMKQTLLGMLAKLQGKTKLDEWAEAVKAKEGYKLPGQDPKHPNGTRSYRNNSPGNLKYSSYTASLGGQRAEDNFARFPSYSVGFRALKTLLTDAANLKLSSYRKYAYNRLSDYLDLFDFFNVYAPSSDNNNPNAYALFVASRLRVDPNDDVRKLL